MEDIKTDALGRVNEIITSTLSLLAALRDFDDIDKKFTGSVFFDPLDNFDVSQRERMLLEEQVLLEELELKLKKINKAESTLNRFFESPARLILNEALVEIQANSLKILGKARRKAYASLCKDALSNLKSAVFLIDSEWGRQNFCLWHSTTIYRRNLKKKKITVYLPQPKPKNNWEPKPLRSLTTIFGSKIAHIARQVENTVDESRRHLTFYIDLMETVIINCLGSMDDVPKAITLTSPTTLNSDFNKVDNSQSESITSNHLDRRIRKSVEEASIVKTSLPTDKQDSEFIKEEDLRVKILLAYQSGLLDGEFHKLPPEKQFDILSIVFGRSRTNVKNSITALIGNANSDKNPRNLNRVVERVNSLIRDKELGIALAKNRKDS